MSKRTIILSSIALVIILTMAGVLVYQRMKTAQTPAVSHSNTQPFGSLSPNATASSTVENSTPVSFGDSPTGKKILVHVSNAATASGIVFNKNNNATLRFVERATGKIYDYNVPINSTVRVSNTTVPSISQSFWSNNGEKTLFQYVDKNNIINTYAGSLVLAPVGSSTKVFSPQLAGRLLSQDIKALAISPNGTKIFYLVAAGAGVQGFSANTDGSKPTKIFASPLTELQVFWPQEGTIILVTKPSTGVAGYAFSLNTKTFTVSQILGGISGLSLMPDTTGTYFAYSDDTNSLKILSLKDGTSVDTAIHTLAEKCTWSKKVKSTLFCAVPTTIPAEKYPDSWYQGIVSFTDSIVKINTTTHVAETIVKPYESYGQSIDAVGLSLSPSEDYLIFTNKKDYTLWSLSLQ